MNVDRLLGSLREAKDARSIEIGVESGVISGDGLDAGEFVTPETLVRRGVLSPGDLSKLRRWTEHLERALLVSRRLPTGTPEEVIRRLRVPGALLGKYVLVAAVGSGGMGAVHRAWDTELSRWVALKLLSESEDQESRARFVREARAVAGLDHPGIIPVYEAGQLEGDFYIAMKLIEGSSLRGLRPPPREAARLIRDAARAVHAAHERGIIHRDLKPANLLLEHSGRVYVSDFGIAHEIRVDTRLTASGCLLGTPSYMAPEQARGDVARMAATTDVYSLGVTLYELLTGEPPFQDENLYELVKRVVEDDPVRIRTLNSATDADLETIALRCLEKEPERRYPTALALAEDLDRYLAGEAVAARAPGVLHRLKKRLGKHPARAGALILAMTGLAATVVFLGVRLNSSRADREGLKLAVEKESALKRDVAQASELLRRALEQVKEAKMLWRVRTSKREQWERLFDSAMEITESAIARYPALPGGPYTRGEILQARGRWSEAIESFGLAISLDPTLPEAWYRRGLCHLELFTQALSDQSIREKSDAARKAAAAPHKEHALADLRRYAQLRGARGDGESRYAGAAVAYAESRFDEAEQACDRLLTETQTDEGLWLLKANILIARKQYEAAVRTVDLLVSSVMPQLADAYHVRGVARMSLREPALAKEDFARAVELDPKADCARVDLGWACGELGDYAGEIEACTKAIETISRPARAYAQRGWARGQLGDHRGKIEDSTKALESDPGYASAYNYRAVARLQLEENQAAVDDLTRALELEPNFASAYANRASGYLKLTRFTEALADCEKARQLDPKDGYDHLRSVIKATMGDLKGGLEDATRAVDGNPASVELRLNRAKVRASLRDWTGAAADASEAIRLKPEQPDGWQLRAEARFLLRDFRGAADDATKLLELTPRSEFAVKTRLAARGELGDARGMIEDCNRLLEIDPKSAHAFHNRGGGWAKLGDWKAADADFSRAIELEPGRSVTYSMRALARGNLKQWTEALRDAEKAVELDPKNAVALVNRGWVHGSKGDYKREIEDCTRALEIDPNDPGAHLNRGWSRTRSGDLAGAVEDYAWLIDRQPRKADHRMERGRLLLRQGDAKAAREDFLKAVELSPGLGKQAEPLLADCEKRLGGK